jgi:hypothetical protein
MPRSQAEVHEHASWKVLHDVTEDWWHLQDKVYS